MRQTRRKLYMDLLHTIRTSMLSTSNSLMIFRLLLNQNSEAVIFILSLFMDQLNT